MCPHSHILIVVLLIAGSGNNLQVMAVCKVFMEREQAFQLLIVHVFILYLGLAFVTCSKESFAIVILRILVGFIRIRILCTCRQARQQVSFGEEREISVVDIGSEVLVLYLKVNGFLAVGLPENVQSLVRHGSCWVGHEHPVKHIVSRRAGSHVQVSLLRTGHIAVYACA